MEQRERDRLFDEMSRGFHKTTFAVYVGDDERIPRLTNGWVKEKTGSRVDFVGWHPEWDETKLITTTEDSLLNGHQAFTEFFLKPKLEKVLGI